METPKERTKRLKSAYYHSNKSKFREWANDRYHKTNPKSAEAIRGRIRELQELLLQMEEGSCAAPVANK